MATFVQLRKDRDDLAQFDELARNAQNLESAATVYVNMGTALHAGANAQQKAEILAARDALIVNLKAIFGI